MPLIPDLEPLLDQNPTPYDAPLTFPLPSRYWILRKTFYNNSTAVSVPAADLTGKWVLITGANSGIGREAALQFAAWGANLVLACRDPPPRELHPREVVEECKVKAWQGAHKGVEVEWWEYEATSMESVERLAQRWLESGRRLDILCNNAGMGSSPGGDSVFRTKDGFEIIHQVNFLSHVLLTLRLLPSLAKAEAPRIVCTTSCFHFPGKFDLTNFNGEKGGAGRTGVQFYQNNKLFFQTWLTELQHRLLQHPQYRHITVNGFHPGYVNSGIWNVGSKTFTESLTMFLAHYLAISSKQGAMGMLHLATSVECGPDPATQGVGVRGGKGGGRYFHRVWEDEPMPHTRDPDCRRRVWRKVDEELGLRGKGLLDVLGG